MSARYNRKRLNDGRLELYDSEQDRWVALALVPMAERGDLDSLETDDAAVIVDDGQHPLSKLDAGLMMGAAQPSVRPRSRIVGWVFGLLVGVVIVTVVALLAG